MQRNPAQNYLQNRIETATPEQLTLMLLEGAGRYSVLAQHCLEAKDYSNANAHLQRCQLILEELMSSLNFDAGPVAKNLFKIYEYLYFRLVQANIRKDPSHIPEVTQYLGELRDSWRQAMPSMKKGARHG